MASDSFSSDESRVKREFWPTLRRVARSIPFAEDAVAAYYCALDRETPTHVRAALLGALVYFIVPFDAVPDFLPLLGFADDASVLAAAIAAVRIHMNDKHREAARRALAEEDLA
ncbi:YkvA family protein [Chenggangzhangella methanolivorans]|uniref:DUF1232 domain-containing protein n=1 Tax=Chenggangzhangella methanolivorans TaxID=1437009 RepID=A0A9E6RD51_9HYPH|nr:YkvA family protein [Chenggangzhangella methanolivorans]QZO01635.1 DUF1232 domain-containing protein [Chenggangzhangella methanolivorans]